MASAGTEPFSVGLRRETNSKLTPAPPEKAKEPKSKILTTQITPVWRLERKYVNLPHRPGNSMIPSSYYVYTDFSNIPVSPIPAPPYSAPSGSFNRSRSLHDTFERTLVFHRPVSGYKPYQKLESLCLRSKVVGPMPYSSTYKRTLIRSTPKVANSESVMTSSLIDQFHMPSAAGEPNQTGIKSPIRKPPKSSNNPISAVANSVLRPSSAKVPLHPHLESKKTKSPLHAGANSASWHNGGKGDFGQTNGEVNMLCHTCVNMEMISHGAPSSSPLQGLTSSKMEGTAWQSNTLQREVPLAEAVQRLAANRDLLNNNSPPQLDATSTLVGNNDVVYASIKKVPAALHPASMRESEPCNSSSGDGYCLNGNASLDSINSANTCTKRISANLLVDRISDSSTSSQAANTPVLMSESQLPIFKGKLPVANITVMASQISTIHLDKTLSVQEKPESFVQEPHLPALNLEPEGAEEELQDGMYDSQEEEEEEDEEETTDSSSLIGVSSTSLAAISRQCDETLDQIPVNEDKIVKPALTPSLFPNMPPTLYFGTANEKVAMLPWAQRKLLKWRMSTVTPNVVKQTIARSHFRVTKKNHDWLGCWGHHMKSPAFKTIREYQKLNHFPGSFQIGRKDRLWRNLSKMQARFGRKEFSFFPQSFVLPQDIKLLRKAWEEGGTRQKWIVKPPASARGMGIQVIHKWSQLPKKRPLLVQRYLHKPYLISGSKFDLRIYVYVTSYDPLRVYLFTDGLVRFASCKYSTSMKSLSNKFMHLTNYSVNKKNADYKSNSDQTACQGHKWALSALWSYLNQKGFSSDKIWDKIKDMVIKTIIASEPYVNSFVKMYVQNPYSCHELFGFDIMLDENLKPWVLEVNISPSLHSNSQLDLNIKGQMVRDLLNLAGYVMPNKEDITPGNLSSSTSSTISLGKERSRSAEVQNEEKTKRAFYLSQKLPDKDLYATVLDQLTPDDVRVLVETEDELFRCGQFERIFPSPISSRYLRFFEQPRYFNILTHQWEQKYFANREQGRDFLKSLCLMEYHNGVVPHSPVWSLPKAHSQGDLYLNGFTRSEVMKHSRSPIKSDVYGEDHQKSLKMSPFRHSSIGLQQPELIDRSRLSQTLANVPESALVM
ncbi:tubulin monoglutamylase TTLL4 [Discoglossus pictus]